jgi:hypothetical protein
MSRQLNIRSDEAYQIARRIAERLNVTTTEAVVRALRDYGRRVPASREGMTPTQQAYFEDLMALARKAARRKKPGATSDHSDMYDEYGLPI